LTQEFYYL